MRSQIWDLVPIGTRLLKRSQKVPILLSSPKFHCDVFQDGYLLWKKMYFDLKYIQGPEFWSRKSPNFVHKSPISPLQRDAKAKSQIQNPGTQALQKTTQGSQFI